MLKFFLCLVSFMGIFYHMNMTFDISASPKIYDSIPVRTISENNKFQAKWDQVKNIPLTKTPEIKNVLIYARNLSLRDKALSINVSVNSYVTYKNDEHDYWQTANETLKLGTGDCEDYAILKYRLLIESGVDPSIIFFVIGKYSGIGHAELVVLDKDQYYVLDNNFNDLLPMPGFKPIFSLNDKEIFYHIG